MLISNKTDFKTKLVKEEDKEYYILVKWSTNQEDLKII